MTGKTAFMPHRFGKLGRNYIPRQSSQSSYQPWRVRLRVGGYSFPPPPHHHLETIAYGRLEIWPWIRLQSRSYTCQRCETPHRLQLNVDLAKIASNVYGAPLYRVLCTVGGGGGELDTQYKTLCFKMYLSNVTSLNITNNSPMTKTIRIEQLQECHSMLGLIACLKTCHGVYCVIWWF